MLYKKPLLLVLTGLAILSLQACSTPSAIKEYVYVTPTIPAELLRDCVGNTREIRTNGDLAQAYQDERAGLIACNLDKEALRALLNQQKEIK